MVIASQRSNLPVLRTAMHANTCEIATVAPLPRNDARDRAFGTMTHKEAFESKLGQYPAGECWKTMAHAENPEELGIYGI